ncbi:MAG: esterase-like activity of phytase family protein [Hyphomicrobiaceae bacterium]
MTLGSWLRLLVVATAIIGGAAVVSRPLVAQTVSEPALDKVRRIEVKTRKISSFSRTEPARRKFGSLEFRGGLVLTSPARAFGGFSGLTVDKDGKHFLAISDEGAWLSAAISYDGDTPVSIAEARLGPIQGLGGRQLDRKKDVDGESIALLDGDFRRGTVLIGFERNHRIGRFPVRDGIIGAPLGYLKLPAEARRMRRNKGFEAVTVLVAGRYKGSVVAFSERYPGSPHTHTGWIWTGGAPRKLTLPDIGGFELTDAASLRDGSLLLLERRFRWTEGVKMRIRRFTADSIRPGHVMEGKVLIEADLGSDIDNMEGLAVHYDGTGRPVLTLISDDNFNQFLQRTILLQFTLTEEPQRASAH